MTDTMIMIDRIVNDIESCDGVFVNSWDHDDYYNLPYELVEKEVKWNYGADKIAIDCGDWVVKAPFAGQFIYTDGFDKEDIENYKEDGFKEVPLEDILIKERKQNPCMRELQIYEEAQSEGLDDFFAQEELYTNDTIIQEKVKVHDDSDKFWDKYEKLYYRNKEKIDELSLRDSAEIPVEVFARLLEDYGIERVCKFIEFLDRMFVNDLDFFNWGINKEGRLVVFDYCGFDDWMID